MATIYFSPRATRLNQKTDAILTTRGAFAPVENLNRFSTPKSIQGAVVRKASRTILRSPNGKGTHKAFNAFRAFACKISHNNTKTVWVLKCDIRKFFASIDQTILIETVKNYIPDTNVVWLIREIVGSFYSKGLWKKVEDVAGMTSTG